MNPQKIAAQMYTVREASAKDFMGALKKVAALGYDGVELAGLYGHDAGDVAHLLADLGLTCVSAHVALDNLMQNLSQELDICATLGADYIVCPWLAPERRKNEDDYLALAQTLDRIGAQCQQQGLQLCYHHHDFELVRFRGKYALDILLEETDPAYLKLEADTYWLKVAGEEPASYIQRWPGQVPLLHLKDVSRSRPVTFAEVGTGTLDWPSIFRAAVVGQTDWYIVEQDVCPGDPFDSLKISYDRLQTLLEK